MPTLDWLSRAEALTYADKVLYRVLEPVSEHGDGNAENLLIQGDNLDALKALLPFYRGRVKCIFIDPPYNTKSAFEHYDDNLEHSQWLSMMYPRLVLLRELLSEDGSIWVTIDDNEGHYLKVMMDEVFGRHNFVANLAWHKRVSPANDAKYFSSDFDHILVVTKEKNSWRPNRLEKNASQLANYRNPDGDLRGDWNSAAYTCAKSADERPNLYYPIINPFNGQEIWPSKTRVWAYDRNTHERNVKDDLLYWGKAGEARMPRIKKFLTQSKPVVPRSIWSYEEAGHNQESRLEIDKLFSSDPFTTPKPERLLKRILEVATNPGDLVLDSFLGSGTTAAVAQKMGRRWIGIEMGEHAETHCIPRLQKVIDGEQGGISEAVNWQGGGGFRFLRLGEAMFNADGSIHQSVRFATLASFVWMQETGAPYPRALPHPNPPPGGEGTKAKVAVPSTPLLGVHKGHGLYLLFNGILGDKRPASGNVLTNEVLATIDRICPFDGPKIIYGEACRLGTARLAAAGATFKHIPYDVKAR